MAVNPAGWAVLRFVGVTTAAGVVEWVIARVLDSTWGAVAARQSRGTQSQYALHVPWDAAVTVPLWLVVIAIGCGMVAALWPWFPGWLQRLKPQRKPLIVGRVVRFEWLDSDDLSEREREEWEEAWKAPSTIVEAIMDDKRLWYKTWLQIEAPSRPTKATNWSFHVLDLLGNPREAVPLEVQWQAPRTWPSINFYTLSQVQNMYLQRHTLYNVFVYLRCPLELDKETLAKPLVVRFTDNNGTLIVLEERK